MVAWILSGRCFLNLMKPIFFLTIKCTRLPFWDFVHYSHCSGESESLYSMRSSQTDRPSIPHSVSGSPSPPLTENRRRKNEVRLIFRPLRGGQAHCSFSWGTGDHCSSLLGCGVHCSFPGGSRLFITLPPQAQVRWSQVSWSWST